MRVSGVERTNVQTDSLDRSIEMISSMYTPIRQSRPEHPTEFRFGMSGSTVDRFRIDHLSHTSGYRMVAEPTDFVGVVTLSRGHASYECDGQEVRITAQQSLAFPGNTRLHVEHSGYELRFVTIPVERIAARAHDVSGVPQERFRMELGVPQSRSDEAHWRATVDFLDAEMRHTETALDNPLVREHALTLLMDVALATFPNNAVAAVAGDERSWAAAAVVRRAVEFIDANAHHPLTPREIAEAAGVDVRTLRAAFARHRETTPSSYLRQTRLQRAERDLREDDNGEATAAILSRWGFRDYAQFARQFEMAFGIPCGHVRSK